MKQNRGLFSLVIGVSGAWVFAIIIALFGFFSHVSIDSRLLLDAILITNMISIAISLFAFSRYVVLRDRLLQFIALAFLVGGFTRVTAIVAADLGVVGGGQSAFSFQLAAWQGGSFLLALMLAVGTVLVWIYPKPKSTLFDAFAGIVVAGIVVIVVVFVPQGQRLGEELSSGNVRPIDIVIAAFFLIAFFGVSRNYLKYPTLFNYSISIALFLMTLGTLVGAFSIGIGDSATAVRLGISSIAYVIGAVGSLVDVGHIFADYVRSSEELKSANRELLKYQVYLEKVPDPVRIVNETGFTLYVNPAFENVFGYTLAEMRVKPIDDLYEQDEREKAGRYAEQVEQGRASELELTVITKGRERREAFLNSALIVIEGKRLGTITVYRDITRRKQLEHHNQVLSAAVENTDEAIALTDPEGIVTYLNTAAEKLFGYTLDELPGRSLWTIVSPSFGYYKARDIYVQTVRKGSWRGEVLNRKKDGTEYFISLSTSSIKDTNGDIIALVGICEDITAKKWEEKRKEAAYGVAQLAFSSSTIGELADSAVAFLTEALGSPLSALYSYDEAGASLQLLTQRNALGRTSSVLPVQKFEAGSETNAERAAKLCKMVFSRSLAETEFSDFGNEPFFRDAVGLISLPLVTSGQLVGVLQYVSIAAPGNIKYEADLADAAANELAAGFQKLKLGGKVAEQSDQLEKIFASAAEGIALVDRKGKVILMNEGGKRTFGLTEIPSLSFADYSDTLGVRKLDGTPLTEDENPVKLAAVDGKDVRNGELLIIRNGTERVISISASPLIDPGRVVSGAVVTFSDTTDQKRNELAVKKQNRRLSVINRTAMAVKDALDVFEILNKSLTRLMEFEGISAAAVYLVNEATGNMNLAASLGFSTYFLKNQAVHSFPIADGVLFESMRLGVPKAILSMGEELKPSVIFQALRREGMISAAVVPIIGTRKTHGVLLAVSNEMLESEESDMEFFVMISRVLGGAVENAFLYSDIIEKSKELEDFNEQLRISKVWVEEANAQLVLANQQLEEASSLKSQFLANMSHELRTPLNSIIGFTNLMLTDDITPPTGEQKEGLEIVLRNARNLLALINDILDLSKIEAGRITILTEQFSLDTVIADSLSTVAPLVGGKHVELISEIDPAIPAFESDPARIKQIILNLLSNAAKFTESGYIKVNAKLMEGNLVSVAVEDTGPGVPADYLELIFEEFRQVDGSNTRKYGGTGLGLSISRRLARMLGGDLTVRSEFGKGSTFTVTLPAVYKFAEKNEVFAKTEAPPTSNGPLDANNLVVCVDDDPEVLMLLKTHLEGEGFEFVGVTDSTRALDTVQEMRPVLVTLDIMMPEKDGWQVLQELKADPEVKDIPVIIHSIVDNKVLALSLGAESYVVKPVEADKIVSIVRASTGTDSGEILVVDDNEDFTDFLRNILERSKFNISTARNGIEAVEFLKSSVPSLVFLDLLMPEMDGFKVVEKMQEDEKLKDVPVVVLTAKEITDEERKMLNSRIKNIVRKEGLTREIILREVNKFIQRKERKS